MNLERLVGLALAILLVVVLVIFILRVSNGAG